MCIHGLRSASPSNGECQPSSGRIELSLRKVYVLLVGGFGRENAKLEVTMSERLANRPGPRGALPAGVPPICAASSLEQNSAPASHISNNSSRLEAQSTDQPFKRQRFTPGIRSNVNPRPLGWSWSLAPGTRIAGKVSEFHLECTNNFCSSCIWSAYNPGCTQTLGRVAPGLHTVADLFARTCSVGKPFRPQIPLLRSGGRAGLGNASRTASLLRREGRRCAVHFHGKQH